MSVNHDVGLSSIQWRASNRQGMTQNYAKPQAYGTVGRGTATRAFAARRAGCV